jgi:hypothetical protein
LRSAMVSGQSGQIVPCTLAMEPHATRGFKPGFPLR